ncbi:MAG: hypothetical protein NWE85_04380, partial [Candidatus Bathyarchaeota archaeon]|nr:hypothetical protein [Candidatus Bathyarchaeota archaeon]
MRSYIFTPLERKRITAFLNGEVSLSEIKIKKIRFRVKTFEALNRDVDLYLRFREAISTVST